MYTYYEWNYLLAGKIRNIQTTHLLYFPATFGRSERRLCIQFLDS